MSRSAAELLHRVDRALTDYARADQVTRTVENLTSLEKQLSPHVEDLGQAVAALDALQQVNQPVERPDTRAAVAACRKTADLVRQNRSAPQDLPRTLRLITDAVKTADATALDAWRESINARMPGLDSLSKLADTLSQLGAAKLQVANLRTAVSDLQRLSRQLPGKLGADPGGQRHRGHPRRPRDPARRRHGQRRGPALRGSRGAGRGARARSDHDCDGVDARQPDRELVQDHRRQARR